MAKLLGSGEVNLGVYVLVILFGMGSWVAVNGLWVELPLLVQDLPEAWNLPSFLVIIIQIANIGPLTYCLARKCCRSCVSDRLCIYVLVVIGALACLLLSFLWRRTLYVAGAERSVALFVLAFLLAMVDCTSSVVFLPFMSKLKPQYLTAFFIGEGLSGLVPALVALAQGASGSDVCVNRTVTTNETSGENRTILVPLVTPPNFSVDVFFVFLFAMMLVCGGSFLLLNYLPACRGEHVKHVEGGPASMTSSDENVEPRSVAYKTVRSDNSNGAVVLQDSGSEEPLQKTGLKIPRLVFVYLLLLTAWVNAMSNGLLPSIQSYSALPYGQTPYHLAVTLSSIANPLTCFLLFAVPSTSKKLVSMMTAVGTVFLAVIFFLASQSPTPPLVGQVAGSALMILIWILNTTVLSCVKVVVATILRQRGHNALFWYGANEQIGSLLGAVLSFVLVNVLQLFTAKYPCT